MKQPDIVRPSQARIDAVQRATELIRDLKIAARTLNDPGQRHDEVHVVLQAADQLWATAHECQSIGAASTHVADHMHRSLLEHELQLRDEPTSRIITDEFNPLNRLELPVAEAHAAVMNELLPIAVWLN